MYELTVNSRKQLERATLRAQSQKPRIEEVGIGMYKVWSSHATQPGDFYYTMINPAPDGQGYEVQCSCPTTRFLCKHVAAIFPHYLMRERQFAGIDVPAPTFTEQVQEIKDICAATEKTLGEYTAEQESFDRSCLFG
jgi:hypothetical protein